MKKKTKKIFFASFFLFFFSFTFCQATVHIFGDNHATYCFSNNGETQGHWPLDIDNQLIFVPYSIHPMGQTTLHRIEKQGFSFLNIQSYEVKENDTVVFFFGEIDVHSHIGKTKDSTKQSLNRIVTSLITNYLNTIAENKRMYKNITCIVCSILPPSNSSSKFLRSYGNLKTRIAITNLCNKKLKQMCPHYNFKFLNLHVLYTKKDGSRNEFFYDKNSHIKTAHNHLAKKRLFTVIDINLYRQTLQ